MGYLVIARKWRPKQFEEVVGQEHITLTLQNAIKKDRVASAYLFSGPRGVGKTTTARILAKALNCEKGPTPQPCDSCTPCQEIAEGHSIDVLEIDGASNRGIDEVRSLRESTRYTPSNLRYKIYIIDEVHMLTTEAFNALLKTLEEPPPHVVFIFATTEANKVPATILSRCQRFDFRRIPQEKIVEQLKKICDQETIQIDDQALYLIARKSEGCMRDSQSLLDQVLSFSDHTVSKDDVISLLGIIQHDEFFTISEAIARKNTAEMFNVSRNMFKKGYDFTELLSGLAEHFHNLLVLKSTGSTEHLVGLEPYIDQYRKVAASFSEIDLIRILQLIHEASHSIRRSASPQIHFETLLARLSNLPSAESIQQIFEELQELKKKASHELTSASGLKIIPELNAGKLAGSLFAQINGASRQSDDTSAATEHIDERGGSGPPMDLSEIKTFWPRIVERVKKQKIHIGSILQEGLPYKVTGNKLQIAFDETKGFHVHTINEHRRLIEEAIREVTGRRMLIDGIGRKLDAPAEAEPSSAEESSTEPALADAVPDTTDESDSWLEQNPMVKKLISSLGGEPVDL